MKNQLHLTDLPKKVRKDIFITLNSKYNWEIIKLIKFREHICGGRKKVGKSNNFKNELTMFTP
jgi:hypothetical protein